MTSPKGYQVAPARAHGDGYRIVENAPLRGRNSLRVAARASLLVEIERAEALQELSGFAGLATRPVLLLGEGSNVLFAADWNGVVLSMVTRGIQLSEDDGAQARVRVQAGENWNEFVHWSLAKGFSGLENLVLIPGSVGAAPIQNIGAYGVEIAEFIDQVEVWDRLDRCQRELSATECAFGYRDSLFKQQPDRYIVTAVQLLLPRQRALQTNYAGIEAELASMPGPAAVTPQRVAEAVMRLRMRKLPDPALLGNAGSFFKNPLLDLASAEALQRSHPDLPAWRTTDGRMKISAAWLIEACGLKGYRQGDAAISAQHALVLVNHGEASGAELLDVARHVMDVVAVRFGVRLEAEPRIVGAD